MPTTTTTTTTTTRYRLKAVTARARHSSDAKRYLPPEVSTVVIKAFTVVEDQNRPPSDDPAEFVKTTKRPSLDRGGVPTVDTYAAPSKLEELELTARQILPKAGMSTARDFVEQLDGYLLAQTLGGGGGGGDDDDSGDDGMDMGQLETQGQALDLDGALTYRETLEETLHASLRPALRVLTSSSAALYGRVARLQSPALTVLLGTRNSNGKINPTWVISLIPSNHLHVL